MTCTDCADDMYVPKLQRDAMSFPYSLLSALKMLSAQNQMVFLLRPLQQLFQSREYPGYTDTKFAWEDDDEDGDDARAGNSNEEQEIVAPRQESSAVENAENNREDKSEANAVTEKVPVEIPREKVFRSDIDSSDDDYSL